MSDSSPTNVKGLGVSEETTSAFASITATLFITASTDCHSTTIPVTNVIPNPFSFPTYSETAVPAPTTMTTSRTASIVSASIAEDNPSREASAASIPKVKGLGVNGETTSVPASITTTSFETTSTDGHLTTIPITTVIPNPSALPTSGGIAPAPSNSNGAIIGGAVGGSLGLILSLILLVLCLRRRRRSQDRFDLLEDQEGTRNGGDTPLITSESGTAREAGRNERLRLSTPVERSGRLPFIDAVRGTMAVTPYQLTAAKPFSPQITSSPREKEIPAAHPSSQQGVAPLDEPGTPATEMIPTHVAAILNSRSEADLRAGSDGETHLSADVTLTLSAGEAGPATLPASGEASSRQDIDLIVARVVEALKVQDVGEARAVGAHDSRVRAVAHPTRPRNNGQAGATLPGVQRTDLSRSISDSTSTPSEAPPVYEE